MTEADAFFKSVFERKMSQGEWFSMSFSQLYDLANRAVDRGECEKRWNSERQCIEFRAVADVVQAMTEADR